MVDELKNIIEEYLNWLYPNPVEVLDIKDFRDYFEVKVKSEPEIPWRSEKDMTMIKNLAKDLEKEWKVDLLLILPHIT